MSANSETFDAVVGIISEQLSLEPNTEIKEQTSIIEDLGADSLEIIEIVMKMEEKFKIKMPENEVSQLKTVGDIVAAIDRKKSVN